MVISIQLPDGSRLDYDRPVSPAEVAEDISPRLARAALAAVVDGGAVDLTATLSEGTHTLRLLTDRDDEALEVLRHTTAHVMAQAVRRLFGPEVQYTIGPALTDDFQYGFYYDFDLPGPISAEDLERIEQRMRQIVAEDIPIRRLEVSVDEARRRFSELGQTYKLELIDDLVRQQGVSTVSLYEQGDFVDLCRGPHLPSTGRVRAFKLITLAGAYWRGDETRPMLTRIYGTAFFDEKALKEHLERIEQARQRDHRIIGRHLELFLLSDEVGPGLPLWLPKGAIIRQELENWLRAELVSRGYQMVITPHIGRLDLYRTSGHYPYYVHGLFPAMILPRSKAAQDLLDALRGLRDEQGPESGSELPGERDLVASAGIEPGKYPWGEPVWRRLAIAGYLCQARTDAGLEDGYLLKPMNCPHHITIYKSARRSYRDLPLRLAEFGAVYRMEQSGELSGLIRVRGFTQDDAHIFCTPEQLAGELESCVELTKLVLGILGLPDYRVRIGLRDPDSSKYVGSPANWDLAEANIRSVVAALGMDYTEEPGEAAFYGPKIDFIVKDCIGREWQLGTIQVDYNIPQRFDLQYVGPDNALHRPVMIHRAPFGSLERFIGILIEHYGGAFPLWLSPVQVAVLPVSEKFNDYGQRVLAAARSLRLRAELDGGADKIGAKVRRWTMQKVPYLFVVGGREAEAGTVSVRQRGRGEIGSFPLQRALEALRAEADSRGASDAFGQTDS